MGSDNSEVRARAEGAGLGGAKERGMGTSILVSTIKIQFKKEQNKS